MIIILKFQIKEYINVMNLINKASNMVPILQSTNMSLGVNVLINLVEKSAAILSASNYDIEIAETHHKHKIDAPSGTALSLGEFAAIGRNENFNDIKVGDIIEGYDEVEIKRALN